MLQRYHINEKKRRYPNPYCYNSLGIKISRMNSIRYSGKRLNFDGSDKSSYFVQNNRHLNLSVIIVNYNVKYFLEQCLFSVLNACTNIDAEIFVVDNNSTDGSREYLEGRFPQVIFKWNSSNDGFAKANNSVLGEVKGGHVLFLNPDTILPEDCFEKCLSFFNSNKNCAALGVHMLDGSGKFLKESKRSFPSPATSFFKLAGLSALFPSSKLFAKYYAGHLSEKQDHEIDVLAGAFMMLSRHVLDQVKGFDEDYFMYGEDIDLSYRIQKSGFKNYYFSGTSIIHFKGESTQKHSYNYIRTFYAAMRMFVNKHYKEKKVTLFLMKTSIGFGRMAASVILFLKTIIKTGAKSPKPINTAILSGQQQFDEMIHLVKHSKIPFIIKGRITLNKNDKGVAIGKLEDIDRIIKEFAIDQLIFCEGEISFKAIIEKMQQLSPKTIFLFHANGSSSIVGSNRKNDKGIFIAE
jgi:GT2 family glycosyltransferase